MKIAVENLTMTYPTGNTALRSVTMEMEPPNLIGLIGPNGAGKSTLMKLLIAGLLPTQGKITVDGTPLMKNEKRLKADLGYLPQSFGLYDELTVWQFLDYMSALKGIRNSKAAINSVIEKTNLNEKRKARIRTLSGGQRQRVGIAQALLGDPKFLILDEPTVGLDPEERINFRNLFSQMAQDRLVLLSTHIIEDVQSVCNRLIVIHKGALLFVGSPEELISLAQGHVGVIDHQGPENEDAPYQVTARVNTVHGASCRIVAETLPPFAQAAEPTLEDAYMYLIKGEGAQQ
jgi:ABC-2 type transport system ATP-binding protein